MKMLKKILRICAFLIPLFALGAWWGVEYALPYMPIKPMRVNGEHQEWRLPEGNKPENYGLSVQNLRVIAPDSTPLVGWFIRADSAHRTGKSILFLHGISGCKAFYLPTARTYSKLGYDCILMDGRAHGESGGEFCTFGEKEKFDISAILDTVLAIDSTQKVGIWGNSLGGAIALQALAHDHRLQFGIIESTFHDFEKVAEEYGADYTGVKSSSMTQRVLRKSAAIAHFDPFSIKPYLAARQITQPVFMAHGDSDDKIPIEFGRINFENLASEHKQWYTVSGAGHHNLGKKGGPAYYEAVQHFLEGL